MAITMNIAQSKNQGNGMYGAYAAGNAPEISQELNSITFDSFENYAGDVIPIKRSTSSEGDIRKYFQKDADTSGDRRDGTAEITSDKPLFGTKSMRIICDTGSIRNGGNGSPGNAGSMFLSYYNQDNASKYSQLSEETAATWQKKTYNMMRYWIWNPPSTVVAATTASEAAGGGVYANNAGQPDGATNHHMGIYLRRPGSGTGTKETDNFKLYHYYNLDYVNNWHCIEVDAWPDAQRSDKESYGDPGDWYWPMENTFGNNDYSDYTGDTRAENYFDMITYFYISDKYGVDNYPSTWWVDGIEFYTEPYADVDYQNIKGCAHTIRQDPGNENTVWVQWGRNETVSKTDGVYSVKYAYSSFYDNGGFDAHGTEAPTSKKQDPWNAVVGVNSGGHNKVHYQTDQIPLVGQDVVYVAVKRNTEATAFREFRIPITAAGYPTLGA